jgi:hypothetical protein
VHKGSSAASVRAPLQVHHYLEGYWPAPPGGVVPAAASLPLVPTCLINRRITDIQSLQHLDIRFRAHSDIRDPRGRGG